MIKVRNLSYSYPESHSVLKELSFEVGKGEFWGVLGKNGVGKTTLMDIFLGQKYPSCGSVLVNGTEVKGLDKGVEDIVFLSQDISIKGDISIKDFLEFNKFFYPKYQDDIEKDLMTYFELNREMTIGTLSTGQQKKVQIVSGLASNTEIILIDEITAVLDPETRIKFFNKLTEFNKEREKTIILATNIYEDLKGRVDKVLYIDNKKGNVIESSAMGSLFNA